MNVCAGTSAGVSLAALKPVLDSMDNPLESKENPNPTPKEKKQMSEEEKEYKSKRKQIQEKLIKFATRIPVFMYLTDFREYTLKDVITKLEPALFKKVTGLEGFLLING